MTRKFTPEDCEPIEYFNNENVIEELKTNIKGLKNANDKLNETNRKLDRENRENKELIRKYEKQIKSLGETINQLTK